jgi:hypothetical protein
MGQRLLRCHIREFRAAAAQERSPAGGQHQPGHLIRAPAAQALRDRGVLGIHRDYLARCGPPGHQRAAGDQ